jgi:hypothetical protein
MLSHEHYPLGSTIPNEKACLRLETEVSPNDLLFGVWNCLLNDMNSKWTSHLQTLAIDFQQNGDQRTNQAKTRGKQARVNGESSTTQDRRIQARINLQRQQHGEPGINHKDPTRWVVGLRRCLNRLAEVLDELVGQTGRPWFSEEVKEGRILDRWAIEEVEDMLKDVQKDLAALTEKI